MTRTADTAAARAEALRGVLDDVAGPGPGPAGGWCAATAVGLGAALVAMAARASGDHLAGSHLLARRADRLRAHAVELAEADVAAYRTVHDAGRLRPTVDVAPWRARLSDALAGAADVPLAVAEAGAEVTALAVRLATGGHPRLRADARSGAVLGEAGARTAAGIVAANAAGGLGPERLRQASAHAQAASACLQELAAVGTSDEPRK